MCVLTKSKEDVVAVISTCNLVQSENFQNFGSGIGSGNLVIDPYPVSVTQKSSRGPLRLQTSFKVW